MAASSTSSSPSVRRWIQREMPYPWRGPQVRALRAMTSSVPLSRSIAASPAAVAGIARDLGRAPTPLRLLP